LQPTRRQKICHHVSSTAFLWAIPPARARERRRVVQHAGLHAAEPRDEERAEQVADEQPILDQLARRGAPAHRRQRHERHVAGQQLRPRQDHQDQP
jgi:hypothetical protein